MKNQNIVVIAIASALAFALGPVTEANVTPQGGPTVPPAAGPTVPPTATHGGPAPASTANQSASSAYAMSPDGENRPIVTINSAGNVLRGKTGSFALKRGPPLGFG